MEERIDRTPPGSSLATLYAAEAVDLARRDWLAEPDLRRYPDIFRAACTHLLLAAPPLLSAAWATEDALIDDARRRYEAAARGALVPAEWRQALDALLAAGLLVPWEWEDVEGVAGYSRDLPEDREVAA